MAVAPAATATTSAAPAQDRLGLRVVACVVRTAVLGPALRLIDPRTVAPRTIAPSFQIVHVPQIHRIFAGLCPIYIHVSFTTTTSARRPSSSGVPVPLKRFLVQEPLLEREVVHRATAAQSCDMGGWGVGGGTRAKSYQKSFTTGVRSYQKKTRQEMRHRMGSASHGTFISSG